MRFVVNIDVPEIETGIGFYCGGLGFNLARRLGPDIAELAGGPTPVYLLQKRVGSAGAAADPRRYERHWTPVHLDIVVEDVESALSRAVLAGARIETEVRIEVWGNYVVCADPFGHGFCLIEFTGRGYDALASP